MEVKIIKNRFKLMKQTKMYDIIFISNGVVKETPLKNKPYPLCKWWIRENSLRYSNGKLIPVDTNTNIYK